MFHGRFFKISKLQGFVLKSMQGWLDGRVIFPIQMLPTFGGRCNRYFWDVRLKIFRLPNFNMLFQLVLTKLSCFRIYRNDHVIKSCKEPQLGDHVVSHVGKKKYPSLLCVWKFTVQLFIEYIIKQILKQISISILKT